MFFGIGGLFFGIGGSLSNPLGSLLVALAGYTPHVRALAGFAGVALGIAVSGIAETRRLWHRNKGVAISGDRGAMILSTSANMD